MDGIVEVIKAAWPIVATFGNVAALAAFAWMKSQFVTKADHEQLDIKVDGHALRLVQLEADDKHEPTRADLNRVTSELGARLTGVEASIKALGHQMQTQNTYLHSLLDNELRGTKR